MFTVAIYPPTGCISIKTETLEEADKVLTAFSNVERTSIFIREGHKSFAEYHNYPTTHFFELL